MNSMSMKLAVIFAVIAGTLNSALAGPRFVFPDDPDGAEIRVTAKMFLERIAEGDATGAKEMFSGDKEQSELLDAQVAMTTAAHKLQEKLLAKIPEAAKDEFVDMPTWLFRGKVAVLGRAPTILNGDSAAVPVATMMDSGMRLQRIGGTWKITHVAWSSRRASSWLVFYTSWTRALRAGLLQLECEPGSSFQQVKASMEEPFKGVMLELTKYREEGGALEAAAGTPGVSIGVAIDDLRKLLGIEFASKEFSLFFPKLPGTPKVELSSKSVFLLSEEAGIALKFTRMAGPLDYIMLCAGPPYSSGRYAGELPEGLSFEMTRKQIEKILGSPLHSYGSRTSAYFAEYRHLGLKLNYGRKDPRDPENALLQIVLTHPDPNAPRPATRPARRKAPRIEFRLVATDANQPADLLDDPRERKKIPVLREVLLTEKDIAEVYVNVAALGTERFGIGMKMTPDGAGKFEQVTKNNIKRQLVIMLDREILFAPIIHDALRDALFIELPPKSPHLHDTLRRLHAAVNALPDE